MKRSSRSKVSLSLSIPTGQEVLLWQFFLLRTCSFRFLTVPEMKKQKKMHLFASKCIFVSFFLASNPIQMHLLVSFWFGKKKPWPSYIGWHLVGVLRSCYFLWQLFCHLFASDTLFLDGFEVHPSDNQINRPVTVSKSIFFDMFEVVPSDDKKKWGLNHSK